MTADPATLFANHYAFLVGIDDYADRSFPTLNAHADARAIHNALLEVGYQADNLRLVPQERTSRQALTQELNDFRARVHDGSGRSGASWPEIIIFWAGHGAAYEHRNYLVTGTTEKKNLGGTSFMLEDLIDRIRSEITAASLTVFLDACYSIPRNKSDLFRNPESALLAPLCSAVKQRQHRQWAFVGVSTWAYEYDDDPPWTRSDLEGRGILTRALKPGILGEPCDARDNRPRSENDCTVSLEVLLPRLKPAVDRMASDLGVNEHVAVHAEQGSGAAEDPAAVGLAVKRFTAERLVEARLPAETDLLARKVVEAARDGGGTMTAFGKEMEELVRAFIFRECSREDFLSAERARVNQEIQAFRDEPSLRSYVWFPRYCRQEASRDDAAAHVLGELYLYFVRGGSPQRLADRLRDHDERFVKRDALPWSCGIRVLRDGNERGYAAIIYEGAPLTPSATESSRTFETTSSLQRHVRMEIFRGDGAASQVGGDVVHCEYWKMVTLPRHLPVGTRVWVKFGPEWRGCGEGCDITTPGMYVPMKVLLGLEEDGTQLWQDHWHLPLGGGGAGIGGQRDPGPGPPWVSSLEGLIEEAGRWLETQEGRLDEAAERAVVTWLYYAERLTRERDESKLRHVLETLIVDLRSDRERSARRLIRALRAAMRAATTSEGPPAVDEGDEPTGDVLDASEVLEEYEDWRTRRTGGPGAGSREDLRRAEVWAALLRAVVATAQEGDAAEQVTQLVAAGPGGVADQLDHVVESLETAGIYAARVTVTRFVQAVEIFVDHNPDLDPVQRRRLLAWRRAAATVQRRSDAEAALLELFSVLQPTLRLAATLLTRGFLDATGLEPSRSLRYAMAGLEDHRRDERQAAVEVYRSLHQLQIDTVRLGGRPSEQGADFLLGLTALLWPDWTELMVQLLVTDAVSRPTALSFSQLVAAPVSGLVSAGVSMNQLFLLVGASQQEQLARVRLPQQVWRALWNLGGKRWKPDVSPPAPAPPQPPAGPYDPWLLQVPPGELRRA